MTSVMETNAPGVPCRRGKVRDVYDLGDRLVLVATDRISAFDWNLPNPIPDKGKLLTALSLFWFEELGVADQILSTDLRDMGKPFSDQRDVFEGRSVLVQKTSIIPFECVARGYVAGSAWKEYRSAGTINGETLPGGMLESQKLAGPLFTPATKAEKGEHDENISYAALVQSVGKDLAEELRDRTLDLYGRAADYAWEKGIIIADTKFEFGRLPNGKVILVDELLTPDSSRFWPRDGYKVGATPLAYDKQFVRDWLEEIGFDKISPPPPLPDEIVKKTRERYFEAYKRLTGRDFE